jgi:hypothetical protein
MTGDKFETEMQAALGAFNKKEASRRREMVEAAHRYAAFDRSDPFALARQLHYIKSGVATHYRPDADGRDGGVPVDAGPAYADATPYSVMRRIRSWGGKEIEFPVIEYRNVRRP